MVKRKNLGTERRTKAHAYVACDCGYLLDGGNGGILVTLHTIVRREVGRKEMGRSVSEREEIIMV